MDAIAPGPSPTKPTIQPTYQQRRRRKEVQLRILRPSYLRSRRSGVSFNPISLQPRKGTLRLLTADKKQYPYDSILPALRGSPSIDTNYFDIFLYFVPFKSNDIKSQCGWSSVQLAHRACQYSLHSRPSFWSCLLPKRQIQSRSGGAPIRHQLTMYVPTTCHVHWTIITFTFYNTPVVVWGCLVEIGQGLLNCKTLIRLK